MNMFTNVGLETKRVRLENTLEIYINSLKYIIGILFFFFHGGEKFKIYLLNFEI